MLVEYTKSFVMEGETTLKKRKHFWCKPREERTKIHLITFVTGICDESELTSAIDKAISKELKKGGWGEDFSGWQRVVPHEEALKICQERGWVGIRLSEKDHISIEYIHNWPMEKILKELTFEQFAQLCKENDIDPYKVKEN